MPLRKGFTLLEMLISTVLLSLVLIGLYGALDLQKNSNKHLFEYLGKALAADKGAVVLYRDIFQGDGNITIKNGEFDRLCIENTSHSLHGLAQAKVCWIVAKETKALLRIEGNGFRLPLRSSDGVEIDEVMKPMELFDVQKDKKKVLVGLKQVSRDPYVFLVQGIQPPPKPPRANDRNSTRPQGSNGGNRQTGGQSNSHNNSPQPSGQSGGPGIETSNKDGRPVDHGVPIPPEGPDGGAGDRTMF